MMASTLDRDLHGDLRLQIELVGAHDIFRFTVNMLSQQVEFCQAGRVALVELREAMTPERFDPMARSMLGEDHAKLASYFLRDTACVVCERDLADGEPRSNLRNAQIMCRDCDSGGAG